MPGVGHRSIPRHEVLAPGVCRRRPAGAGGVLPLDLRGQLFSGPDGVHERILEGDVHNRVPVASMQRAARAFRRAPVGARCPVPPPAPVVEWHRPARRAEHERSRDQLGRIGSREVGRIWRVLSDRHVGAALDEASELGVGDRMLVHDETGDEFLVRRPLLRIVIIAAHDECARRHVHHVLAHRVRCSSRHLAVPSRTRPASVTQPRPGSSAEGEWAGRPVGLDRPMPTSSRCSPG